MLMDIHLTGFVSLPALSPMLESMKMNDTVEILTSHNIQSCCVKPENVLHLASCQ